MSVGNKPLRSTASTADSPGTLRFVKSETKVSGYDLVSAFLVSSLLIVGFFASILGLIWFNSSFNFDTPAGIIIVNDPGEDGDEKPEGFEDDAFDPGVEEFPEIETPQLAQALEAVTDAVSSVKASLAERSGNAAVNGAGGGYGSREGGPGGSGDGIPEYKRWKINYQAEDISTYREQLSFWGIDIGVVSRESDDVYRVRDPAGTAEVIPTDREKEGKSLYFAHVRQRMMRWDQSIATAAGVDIEGGNMIQFYSNRARERIRLREAEFLAVDEREKKDIRTTQIKLVAQGDEYDFIVQQINYRN